MDSRQDEIAAAAARLVVQEGLDYGSAKRRAASALGLSGHARLPDNDALQAAVRDYLAVFCADTQLQELAALRRLALTWMQRLAVFRPHLCGAVWNGTATRLADIELQLFCDDPKSAEIALLDAGVRYRPSTVRGFTGAMADALSVHSFCPELAEMVGVHLMVHDHDDLRGALRRDRHGRAARGDLAAVRALLHDAGHE